MNGNGGGLFQNVIPPFAKEAGENQENLVRIIDVPVEFERLMSQIYFKILTAC
jgi:hypothetical protein